MLIDWFTTLAQVLNFLILVWLLKRFLYKPILRAIDERETKIAAKISNAEKIQSDAKKESNELKKRIKEIDDQRDALLSKAAEEAQAERERLLEKARNEVIVFTEKSREEFKREEKQAQQSIIQRTQKEVFAITRKVLIDLAGTELESQMVNVFIRRFGELDENKKKVLTSAFSSKTSHGVVRSTFELTPKQRVEIESAICEFSNKDSNLQFEIVPDSFLGIELIINGHKLAWSVDNYLASMEKEFHIFPNSEKKAP